MGLKTYKRTLSGVAVSYISLKVVQIFFALGRFREALEWCDRIVSDTSLENASPRIYSSLRMIALLIHFELKNDEFLEHLISTTYRSRLRKGTNYKFEGTIISFLKKAIAAPNASEQKELFKKLKADMEALAKDPYEAVALSYFMYIEWVDSKITQQPLMDIIREKKQQTA